MKKFFELQRFAKTVKLTNKADNYENETENVKILALGGNDTIKNWAEKVTIDGGAGNDFLWNYSRNVSISGGAGSDSIIPGDFTTVMGGKGNDTIDATGGTNHVIKYLSGDGNDLIQGFNSSDTLYIAKGSYTTMTSNYGSDFIVRVGKQKITLKYATLNKYDKVIIKDSSGNVFVYNDWKVMNGTNGNDDLYNEANNVTVNGGKGNDYISSYGSYVTILGGAGNDRINVDGDGCVIKGGKGNDSIDLDYAGAANNAVIQYASGDGKDTVDYFGSDDILHITKGSYSVKTSGDDVIVKVGKGSITLKDAVGTSISIKNSSGKVTTKTYGSSALFAENNFATTDNLSSIVKSDFDVADYKIETANFENLTQENNFITFAEK